MFLHIVAAMTWIGGMLFLGIVIVPLLRRPEMRDRDIASAAWRRGWDGPRCSPRSPPS